MNGCWQSACRIHFCLYSGITAALLTWVISYILWLQQGCIAFLPCVSDFAAGRSADLFMWGMTCAAALLLPTWFDYYTALKVKSQSDLGCCRACLQDMLLMALPLFGTISSLCIIGVALNPWGRRLVLHLFSAGCLFWAGGVFLAADSALSYLHNRSFKHVLGLTCFGFFALVLMVVFIALGFQDEVSGDHAPSFSMIEDNFIGYCTGGAGSFHMNPNFNIAALFEWILLLTGSITCCARLQSELSQLTKQAPPHREGGQVSSFQNFKLLFFPRSLSGNREGSLL